VRGESCLTQYMRHHPSAKGTPSIGGRLLIAVALMFTVMDVTSAQPSQTKDTVSSLEPGKPIERELAGAQSHLYEITLSPGEYLHILVDQRGVDVVVLAAGPDGKPIVQVDTPNGDRGPESIEIVSEAPGKYRFLVSCLEPKAPKGQYEIRVVDKRRATETDRRLAEARGLDQQFAAAYVSGKYDEALSVAERSLAIREKIPRIGDEDLATSLNNLALIHLEKGNYEKSEALYNRSLALTEKVHGSDHPDVAQIVNNLARIRMAKGDLRAAETLFTRALQIREKVLGQEDPSVALTINNLAQLFVELGDYKKAEPLYQRAQTILEKALGPEHFSLAFVRNSLGMLYEKKGDYQKAAQEYQRAVAIGEKAFGDESPSLAPMINSLAVLYETMGDYVAAEPLYRRSLAIREKAYGSEHPEVAEALNNLAGLYFEKGDYDAAEPLYRRSLAIREKLLGPVHTSVARALNNLAVLYNARKDYRAAQALVERALAIEEKAYGPQHPTIATTLNNLASLYSSAGDHAKAEAFYQRAIDITEKAYGPDHPSVGLYLNNLAFLYFMTGNAARAESFFQRSLKIREQSLGGGHPRVAESLGNLSAIYTLRGDIARAVDFQSRSNEISERNIALNVAVGSERQKLSYLATLARQTSGTISLHVNAAPVDAGARRLALTTILRRKGRALDAMADSIAALRRRLNPEDQVLLDRLSALRSELANLVLNGPANADIEKHRAETKRLESEIEQVETEISRRSSEFRAQTRAVTIESIQQAIPADGVLIEIAVYQPFDAKRMAEDEGYGEPRYVAYILRHQGEPSWVELGTASEIDKAVQALRDALRDPSKADALRLARRVDEMVMRPIRALLGEDSKILLSPDGALNLIPFAALVDERNHFLIERYSFTYLTTGRDLLRLQLPRGALNRPVIVANPDFGSQASGGSDRGLKTVASGAPELTSPAIDFTRVRFTPLPGTAEEAQSIQKVLTDATVLTKTQATEAAMKQLSRPSILHVATHGFFLESAFAGSTNRPNRGLTIAGPRPEATITNPLLRSGLGLAGANLKSSTGEDGILTALEVSALDLWGTRLVVLSACDTGVGEVKTGEGVYGLRRALVLAGSESQVMTLWPVSDAATRDLMIWYYSALNAGKGRSAALREVQLRMLSTKKREHPYYWASFIQSGDWRSLTDQR